MGIEGALLRGKFKMGLLKLQTENEATNQNNH